MKSKTISLRISQQDLDKLDELNIKGLPIKSEQIRRITHYYIKLDFEQQLSILKAGFNDEM